MSSRNVVLLLTGNGTLSMAADIGCGGMGQLNLAAWCSVPEFPRLAVSRLGGTTSAGVPRVGGDQECGAEGYATVLVRAT